MTTELSPEQPLLPLIATGDEEAMRALIDRYAGLVWSIARRMLWDDSDAENVLQEIYVALWRSAGRFDESKASEKTFVAMIARRRIIDRIRQRTARPERATDDFSAIASNGTSAATESVESGEAAQKAFEAFKELSPDQQRVLTLSIQHGRTHEEIARALSLPLGTVKTHARRGLIKVRSLLSADEGTGVES